MLLKKSQNSQKKTCVGVFFYRKETQTQVFSCDFLEILNSNSGQQLLLIFILQSLDRCFPYFQQMLITIKYTYIQITDTCILKSVHNYVICTLQQQFFTVFDGSCARSAATDWNNAKSFVVAFSQSWNKFYLKSFKEPQIYDVHTEGRLVISPVLNVWPLIIGNK